MSQELQIHTPKEEASHIDDSKKQAVATDAGDSHEGQPQRHNLAFLSRNKKTRQEQEQEAAKDFIESHGGLRDITEEESTRVQWKIDRFLMPMMMYMYFLQQLDKSALGYSVLFGIQTDAHLVGQQYAWLNSIVYFAQLVCQPLSVYALVVFPINRWICTCFTGWSISLVIMAAMTGFPGLMAMRFFLGAFEATIAPTFVIVTSMWWTRREQPFRVNIWYSMNGIAGIVGSLATYGLGHIQTDKLHSYQIIFLFCGLLSFVMSIPTWFLFPARPSTARFLTTDEKLIALERIRANNTGEHNQEFKWSQVKECLLDLKTWGWVLMIFSISVISGGIGSFGGLILQGFGLTSFQTILYNMIPGVIIIVSNLVTAYLIMRSKKKSPVIFVASLFPLASAVALYILPRGVQYKQSLLAVYFVLQVLGCLTANIMGWAFANTAGHTKKSTLTGMIFVGLTVGNIVGPQLYLAKESPYYYTGLKANLVLFCVFSATVVLQAAYLGLLNRRNVARRRALGKAGEAIDLSLEASSKWADLRATQAQTDTATRGITQHNTKAFDDCTDLQNEDFVYSL